MRNLKILDNLKHYGIHPDKKFGQNFLLDELVLYEMVEAAGVTKDDLVIEVGPGIGNLTRLLLEKAGHVISVEKDERMTAVLRDLKQLHETFYFEIGDALHVTPSQLLASAQSRNKTFKDVKLDGFKVVANIPYYVTGKLVQHFLNSIPRPKTMVVLVQKEVAENITAKPGDLNILGVSVQIIANATYVKKVTADSFYPAPKVDSAVVKLDFPEQSPFLIKDERQFFKVLKACFLGKRKQLHNTLKNNLGLPAETVAKVLEELKINPGIRPQQLAIQTWIDLSEKIGELQAKK